MPARATAARSASSSSAPSAGPASGRPPGAPPCSACEDVAAAVRRLAARPRRRSSRASRSPRPGSRRPGCSTRFDPLVGADELPALLERAPLDLRVNRLKGTRRRRRSDAAPTPLSPLGLRLPEGTKVEQLAAWRLGLVEVQDEGSQLICLACGAAPGMLAVDLCAGAGGKTLALAAEMANEGRLVACDTDRGRLSAPAAARRPRRRLDRREPPARSRARGRGARRPRRPGRSRPGRRALLGHRHLAAQSGDALAGDAGAARAAHRAPGPPARSRRDPAQARRHARLCGLLAARRGGQGPGRGAWPRRSSLVPEPLAYRGRAGPPGPGLLLSPARDGTDGFFVARWRRPC